MGPLSAGGAAPARGCADEPGRGAPSAGAAPAWPRARLGVGGKRERTVGLDPGEGHVDKLAEGYRLEARSPCGVRGLVTLALPGGTGLAGRAPGGCSGPPSGPRGGRPDTPYRTCMARVSRWWRSSPARRRLSPGIECRTISPPPSRAEPAHGPQGEAALGRFGVSAALVGPFPLPLAL